MFLEYPELGFTVYSGTPTGIKSNEVIISKLGLGTVRFDDYVPPDGGVGGGAVDCTYRTDTDVITSVTVFNNSSDDIDPDENAKVTFNINGNTYKVPFITPPFEETLVWVKWHTPTTPKTTTISVSTTHERKNKFTFTKNKHSYKGSNSHYTPIWFPDNKRYEPFFYLFDVWTPTGQLYTYDSGYVSINGDVLDD